MTDNYAGLEARKTALRADGYVQQWCACTDYKTASFSGDGYLTLATCERHRMFWELDSTG